MPLLFKLPVFYIIDNMEKVEEQKPVGKKSDKEVVIHIEHLKKSFGKKTVLTDINLEVHRGENLVVLGKSGQGKSVTIQCLVGLLTPDSGSIKVFGDEVTAMNEEELKQLRMKIGFLFQSGALFD